MDFTVCIALVGSRSADTQLHNWLALLIHFLVDWIRSSLILQQMIPPCLFGICFLFPRAVS